MNSFVFLRACTAFLVAAGATATAIADTATGTTFHAAGWMGFSVVGNSSDTAGGADYDGKNVLSTGALLTIDTRVSNRLDIVAGIGVATGNTLNSSETSYGGYSLHTVQPFVSEARFTYAWKNEPGSRLLLRGGLFSYVYNPDVKNLGLYLMRGPVYPGYLLSGFETKHVLPVTNVVGLQLRHESGPFLQDLLLTSDTEFFPFFDLSPAYIASISPHSSFRFGAGVNFHHLIAVDKKLTSGKSWPHVSYADTAGGASPDTTYLSFAGTKVAAFASFDPKAFFSSRALGDEDLKVYGEVALIGLDNDKAHREVYGDYSERMPVMVGFNLPVFKMLDHLSLEVEWYGARFVDDLERYKNTADVSAPSPFPYKWDSDSSVTRDDWKWSLHGARTFGNRVRVSFQVANDHWRPGVYVGDGDNNPPRRQAILITPEDWYASFKLAWFL